jgi:hypothetical protein
VAEHGFHAGALGERADRVDHVCDRLVLRDHLKPARHRLHRHVGARDEGQREDHERQALRSLGVVGHHAKER